MSWSLVIEEHDKQLKQFLKKNKRGKIMKQQIQTSDEVNEELSFKELDRDITELIGFCPECCRELDDSEWNGECTACERYGEKDES